MLMTWETPRLAHEACKIHIGNDWCRSGTDCTGSSPLHMYWSRRGRGDEETRARPSDPGSSAPVGRFLIIFSFIHIINIHPESLPIYQKVLSKQFIRPIAPPALESRRGWRVFSTWVAHWVLRSRIELKIIRVGILRYEAVPTQRIGWSLPNICCCFLAYCRLAT